MGPEIDPVTCADAGRATAARMTRAITRHFIVRPSHLRRDTPAGQIQKASDRCWGDSTRAIRKPIRLRGCKPPSARSPGYQTICRPSGRTLSSDSSAAA